MLPLYYLLLLQPRSVPAPPSMAGGTNLVGDVGMQVRANATGAMTGHHIVADIFFA